MRLIPLRARPLLASVGAGLSLTAAIAVVGLTALVATGVGVEFLAPVGDGGAAPIRLAEVPRVERSGSRSADRYDRDAPAPRSVPAVVVRRPANTDGSTVRAGKRDVTPSRPRVRRESAPAKRVHRGRPLPSAPVAQAPVAQTQAQAPASAATDAAAVANPAPPATGPEVSEQSHTAPRTKTVRPRPTRGRADARPVADSRHDTRTDRHSPEQTVSAPSVSPPNPPQRTARGRGRDFSRGKAVGHVSPVAPAAPPQPVEPPDTATAPAVDPPGHAKWAGEHPGGDRGRGRQQH